MLSNIHKSKIIIIFASFYLFTINTTIMAKKKEVIRKYNFSDGYLKQISDNTLILLDRDVVAFNDMGFTSTKRSDYVQTLKNFADYPSDEQLEGIKINTTEVKTVTRSELERIMRTIGLIAKIVFKEGTGKYKEFGNTDLTRQTDEELIRNAKIMSVSATKYLTDLASDGLTSLKIQTLDITKQTFDDAIDAQRKAISERDTATEARIELGNVLYELVAKYSEIGKNIWYDNNEAKYNDYIIYNTSTGQPEPII